MRTQLRQPRTSPALRSRGLGQDLPPAAAPPAAAPPAAAPIPAEAVEAAAEAVKATSEAAAFVVDYFAVSPTEPEDEEDKEEAFDSQ